MELSLRASFNYLVKYAKFKKAERQRTLEAVVFFINYQRKRVMKKLVENVTPTSSNRYKDMVSITFNKLRLLKLGLIYWQRFCRFYLRNDHFTQMTNIFPTENRLLLRQYFHRLFELFRHKVRKQLAKRLYIRKNKLLLSNVWKSIRNYTIKKLKQKRQYIDIDDELKRKCLSKALRKWSLVIDEGRRLRSRSQELQSRSIAHIRLHHCFRVWASRIRSHKLAADSLYDASKLRSYRQKKIVLETLDMYSQNRLKHRADLACADNHHRQRLLVRALRQLALTVRSKKSRRDIVTGADEHFKTSLLQRALEHWHTRVHSQLHQEYSSIVEAIHFWKIWRQARVVVSLKRNVLRKREKRAKNANAVAVASQSNENQLSNKSKVVVVTDDNPMADLLAKLHSVVKSAADPENTSKVNANASSTEANPNSNSIKSACTLIQRLPKPRPLPEAARSFSSRNCVAKLLTFNEHFSYLPSHDQLYNPYSMPNVSNRAMVSSRVQSKNNESERQAEFRLARDLILFVKQMRTKLYAES